MKTNNKTIVCSPTHYVLDKKNTGSEFGWAYEIYKGLSQDRNNNYKFIAGAVRGIDDINVFSTNNFSPDKIDLSIFNIFYFYWKTFIKTFLIIKNTRGRIILHHVLPFSIGNSFNLCSLISNRKFILGPVQSSLRVHDSDLSLTDLRSSAKKATDRFNLDFVIHKLISPIIKILSDATLIRADAVICINEYTKTILEEKGVSPEKILVIPPGIDTTKYQYTKKSVKRKPGIELLSVGYLLRRKGVDLLIRAMELIVQKHPGVLLRVVGDGPQRPDLEKLARKLKLSKNIVFVGNVPNSEIQQYYMKSDIFVSMSRSESFGSMYLEAMSCGLPVVCSKNDGSTSIISDERTGYLVDQEDYVTLSQKIVYLVENMDKTLEMGKNARRRIEEKYDWDKVIIPQYLAVYDDVDRSK